MFSNRKLEYLNKLEKERDTILDFAMSDDCSQKQFSHCMQQVEKIDAYLKYQTAREEKLITIAYS